MVFPHLLALFELSSLQGEVASLRLILKRPFAGDEIFRDEDRDIAESSALCNGRKTKKKVTTPSPSGRLDKSFVENMRLLSLKFFDGMGDLLACFGVKIPSDHSARAD
jgi:hypothetical protein